MKKEAIILFFVFSIFLSGCSLLQQECESGLFTKEGKCCSYICTELECLNGFVEGTCQCECIPSGQNVVGDQDTNIDDIFDDNADIQPPPVPT